MNHGKLPPTQYRIYIIDDQTRFYLRDWVVCDEYDHLIFDADRRYAMKFARWNIAMRCRDRMVILKYQPHIEAI